MLILLSVYIKQSLFKKKKTQRTELHPTRHKLNLTDFARSFPALVREDDVKYLS